MDWGKWEEETEGQTDGHWGGDTIWVLFGAPVPGGHGGIVRAGAPGFTPFPPGLGSFCPKWCFFGPN